MIGQQYWEYLLSAARYAYTTAAAVQSDPRGAPGTYHWSSSYYGVNTPVLPYASPPTPQGS